MKVVLAGYNLDQQVIDEARRAGVASERLTPEVLSAAYARISRDPRDVTELRRVALEEVEKAKTSNRKIIFEMGHHSVAEHAVFNFDVVGISRLAVEWLERYRLCSFTEKSQRYITLNHDFVMPSELAGTPFERVLLSLVARQAECYESLYKALQQRLAARHPDLAARKSGQVELDGAAKEDARYVTLLATTGQLGLTVNARNLELLIRRFHAAPIEEVRAIGRALFEEASRVAPSLLLFTDVSAFDAETGREIGTLADRFMTGDAEKPETYQAVRLISHTADPDRVIAAALLHVCSNQPLERCRQTVDGLSEENLKAVFEAALRRMEFFDSVPREFEHVVLYFELVLSASAFAQLKRHRMSTQSVQDYEPGLGLTIPPAIADAGQSEVLVSFAKEAEDLYRDLGGPGAAVAAYALTNAHRRRVLLTVNVRELYHIVRLREDHHAQWDIRQIAEEMRRLAENAMPLAALLLCGKDRYEERFRSIFGTAPSAIPPK